MRTDYVYQVDDEREEYHAESNTTDKITYLLVGGGIGAIIALLFAPKAGHELRGDLADVTRKGYDKTRETAQQLRDQSSGYYQQLRHNVNSVSDHSANADVNTSVKIDVKKIDRRSNSLESVKDDLSDANDLDNRSFEKRKDGSFM